MEKAILGIAAGLQSRPALLAVVAIALIQMLLIWRRRGASEIAKTAKDFQHSSTPVFQQVLKTTSYAQYGMLVIAGIQELGIQLLPLIKAWAKV
jgi:hypothetical protein